MSRKVLIQLEQPDPLGPMFGRVVDPADFTDWQDFAHEHVEDVQRALLTKNTPAPLVEGFDRTLPGGLQVSVAAGHVFTAAGRVHETLPAGQATSVTLAAADPAQARVDLVYALLETDAEAESELKPFRRLRTQAELEAGADPYPPTQLNVATESHTRATVMARAGTPSGSPAAPALQANEVALYHVTVPAAAVNLVSGNVADVRNLARSLYDALVLIDALNANPVIASFAESVQDVVGAMLAVAANTGLGVTYNDVANTLTLAGVAATQAVMGMLSAADKTKLDNATNAATASALAQRDANGDASFRRVTSTVATGASPLAVASTTEVANLNANMVQGQTLANLDARYVNAAGGDTAEGPITVQRAAADPNVCLILKRTALPATSESIDFRDPGDIIFARIQESYNLGGNDAGSVRVWCSTRLGSLTEYFRVTVGSPQVRVFGDFNATGSITGASKSFLIDHPDPARARERFLRYNAPEMPEVAVMLRGRATLVGGRAVVDLDEAARQSHGTLEHLARNFQAHVWNESAAGSEWEWEPVRASVEGARLTLRTRDPRAAFPVGFFVVGERQDPFILGADLTDEEGCLIVEFDKPELTPGDVDELLRPRTEVREADEAAEDRNHVERVNDLAGVKGQLLHPEARGVEAPTRPVKICTVARGQGRERPDGQETQ